MSTRHMCLLPIRTLCLPVPRAHEQLQGRDRDRRPLPGRARRWVTGHREILGQGGRTLFAAMETLAEAFRDMVRATSTSCRFLLMATLVRLTAASARHRFLFTFRTGFLPLWPLVRTSSRAVTVIGDLFLARLCQGRSQGHERQVQVHVHGHGCKAQVPAEKLQGRARGQG